MDGLLLVEVILLSRKFASLCSTFVRHPIGYLSQLLLVILFFQCFRLCDSRLLFILHFFYLQVQPLSSHFYHQLAVLVQEGFYLNDESLRHGVVCQRL